jgi:hypothetical protein
MVYQRVSKFSSGNSQIHKQDSASTVPAIPVQAKSDSASPQEQEMPSYTPLAADWVTNNNLMKNLSGAGVVQRQEESGEKEIETIQAKLTIGEVGDKYEQEADQTAQQVVNQINAPAPVQSSPGQSLQREEMPQEEELQMKPTSGILQREEMPQEEELQMKPMVQLKPDASGMQAKPDLEASIQQAKGGGQPLSDNIKQPMEKAFGADFSGVKVHTDAHSDQLNQSIQAKAFTTGQDVFFRQGAYDPSSQGGQELIAHELTHVVQQNGTAVQRRLSNEPEHQSNQGVQVGKTPAHLSSKLTSATGIVQCGQLSDQELADAKARTSASRNFWQNLKNQTQQVAPNPSKAPFLGGNSTKFEQTTRFWKDIEPKANQQAKVRPEDQQKPRFNHQDKDVNEETKRFEEIEKGIPKDFEAIDEIAAKSVYKNLRKVGENSKKDYDGEYKSSGDLGMAAIKDVISRLEENHNKLKEIEQNIREITEKNVPDKEKQIEKLNEQKESTLTAIKDYKERLKDQEISINAETLELEESQFKNYKVKYLTEPERKQFSLDISGGTISQNGKEYDTKDSFTMTSGRGSAIYVMDPNGKFYAGPHMAGRFHHSSFLAGGAVAGAGEMQVTAGKLTKISNKSGHYNPNEYQVFQTLAQLQSQGVDLNNVSLELLGNKKKEQPNNASNFIKINEGELAPEKNSIPEDTIKSFRALGFFWMNGQWRSKTSVLNKDDVKTANKIVKKGGADALNKAGAVLDSKDKLWKTSRLGLNLSLPELVQALENSDYIKDQEKEKEDKDKQQEEFDRLVGDNKTEALEKVGLKFDDDLERWEIPDTNIEVELADQIRLLRGDISVEKLQKQLESEEPESDEDEKSEND